MKLFFWLNNPLYHPMAIWAVKGRICLIPNIDFNLGCLLGSEEEENNLTLKGVMVLSVMEVWNLIFVRLQGSSYLPTLWKTFMLWNRVLQR